MAIPVLIMGPSGTGKSFSLRNFTRDEVAVINVLGKILPFPNDLQTAQVRGFDAVRKVVTQDGPINAYVVDDFGYVITDYYVEHTTGPNKDRDKYAVFTNIAANTYRLVNAIMADTAHRDRVVYMMMHDDTDANGNVIPATVGKMLNEKVNLLGMFTIVIQSEGDGESFKFNVSKPPSKGTHGMFAEGVDEIDNDLKAFDAALREAYRLAPLDYDRADRGAKDGKEPKSGDRL